MVDVCVVFTPFYCENRIRTPHCCASFSVPLLTLWDEKGFFRAPAIACSKSILIRPVYSKSTFRKNANFENSFRSSLCGRGTLFGYFWGCKMGPKSARNMHRLERNAFRILYFLGEVDLVWPGSVKIDFGHEIPTTRKWSFSSQSLKSGTENGARPEGVRNRFSQ